MGKFSVIVTSLLCSFAVLPQAASAADGRLTLDRPAAASHDSVRLVGKAPTDRRAVVLQRRSNGEWVREDRIRVLDGAYRTTVRMATSPLRYRTVAGRDRSTVRTVPGVASGTTATEPIATAPITAVPATQPPAPAPALRPAADACGAALLSVTGARRVCTFADNFDGSALNRTKWVVHSNKISGNPTGNYACARDHKDNVSVSAGALHLTVRDEGTPVPCGYRNMAPSRYTAGQVSTYRLFSQAYGRFEARIKTHAANGPGLQEAFWLWPDDRQQIPVLWPAAGEIDIVETYSLNPNLAIPFLHYTYNDNGGPIPGVNTAWNCVAKRGVWNTYALEWSSSRLEVFVNGKSCLVNTSGDSAFQRKYIIALTAALGVTKNQYVGTVPLPARMSIDYVRVWK